MNYNQMLVFCQKSILNALYLETLSRVLNTSSFRNNFQEIIFKHNYKQLKSLKDFTTFF